MNTKKNKQANLERKRGLFFQIGLIIILLIFIIAFEWGNTEKQQNEYVSIVGVEMEIEMVPIKIIEKPKPKKNFKKINHNFKIIENSEEINEENRLDNSVFENIPDWSETFIIEPEFEPIDDNNESYIFADVMPKFPGGEEALKQYIFKNLNYPVEAQENNISGKIYVKFVVTKKGEVTNVSLIRSVHPLLDNEAIRVVQSLPDWIPGRQAGKKINVWFTIPIIFQIIN